MWYDVMVTSSKTVTQIRWRHRFSKTAENFTLNHPFRIQLTCSENGFTKGPGLNKIFSQSKRTMDQEAGVEHDYYYDLGQALFLEPDQALFFAFVSEVDSFVGHD